MRLDQALVARYPGLSRRKAQAAVERGQVLVDGQVVDEPGRLVAGSSDVVWDVNRPARRRLRCPLPVLHDGDDVLVVDKPAGLLSVPTGAAGREESAFALLREYALVRSPRQPYVGRVHRLDRDTSGALAFALTPATRQALIGLFSAHRIERRYLALVRGEPLTAEGVVDLPISDEWEGGRRHALRAGEQGGSPAHTAWRVRERLPGATLLEVELRTGRQHQIRVHLSAIGLPVLGDPVYARDAPRGRDTARPGSRRARLPPAPRQMLHAQRLAFTHPLTGTPVQADSPLPDDFEALLTRLRHNPP